MQVKNSYRVLLKRLTYIKGNAIWPAQIINYTNKTQFLFRIAKGTLDVNDQDVNNYYKQSEIRIPYKNIIYLGDSDTDVPCMKIINERNGYSIGVYDGDIKDKTKVYKMMHENRIKYFAEANYSQGSTLEKLLFNIINKIKYESIIDRFSLDNYDEVEEYYQKGIKPNDSVIINELISNLEFSTSFLNTHSIIKKLNAFDNYDNEQIKKLCSIAINNSQVRWIINDNDVNSFYKKILDIANFCDDLVNEIREIL